MHLPGSGCSGSMGQVHTKAGGGWGKVAAAGLWPGNAHEETIMSRHLEQPPSLPHSLPSLILTLFLSWFCVAPSLESNRLVYSSWVSNGLYVAWLVGIIYAHAQGSLNTDKVMVAQGRLFQDISG